MTVKNDIRNLGILAHVDAGKTTITEQMLYRSGSIRTAGSVDKGTAYTDYLDVERQRGISVCAASIPIIWNGVKINIIDTPGHVDFSSEVERAVRVMDCAVLVLSAAEGVQAQAEVLWRGLRKRCIPTIIFINKIDRIGSNTKAILDDIHNTLSPYAIPLQVVHDEGTAEPAAAWIDLQEGAPESRNAIVEVLAEKDDVLLEKYLDGQSISGNELRKMLVSLTNKGEIFPVLYGSAIKGVGIEELMDAAVKYLPGPSGSRDLPLSAVVYKINYDEAMGRTAHVRLYNGEIKPRDMILNATTGSREKITQIRSINGPKYQEAGGASAGDIAALAGLSDVHIGDVLGGFDGIPQSFSLSFPYLRVQAFPGLESDYPKLVDALIKLSDEDPMLGVEWDRQKREVYLKIMGLIQMEVLSSILKDRFGLLASFSKASVIYKETPSKQGTGFVSYTMPKPCWAVLKFDIQPLARGCGIEYCSTVRTEYIPERYQKQVEKTIPKALEQGRYGWEVTDARITLIDGEYHVEHTHPPDFAVAAPMAIMDGLANTGTTLLEPMLRFQVTAPEDMGGRIINDIVQMRGSFDSPVISGGRFMLEGIVPGATSLDYHIKLSSMTGGRGTLSTSFTGYSECSMEHGQTCPRRGADPLDRAKYILYARNAIASE